MDPPYGLIVSDLDGTLLSGSGELAAAVLASVEKAKAAGIRFTVATGRSLASVRGIVDLLRPNAPIVLHNGAQIYDRDRAATIRATTIPRGDARRIVRLLRRLDVHVNVFREDGAYYEEESDDGRFSWDVDGLVPERGDLLDAVDGGALKIQVVRRDAAELDRIAARVARQLPAGVAAVRSASFCYEIGAAGASKSSAVKTVARHCGVPLRRVIACGDGLNDLDMLRTVARAKGIAVAPCGAVPEVAALRSIHVVPPEAADVVSFVIDRFCAPDDRRP